MSTFTSVATFTVVPDGSSRTYTTTNTVTDDLLHAYVQEFQLTSAEDEIIFDTADDPNYSDFVLLRIEVIDWGSGTFDVPVRITSGSDSCEFTINRVLPVFELYGMDVYTDDSNGGSPDTIDEVSIRGNSSGYGVTTLGSPIYIRVTAYTVAS